jgi:uncharacterized protein (TIGR00303 family)
MPCLFINAGLQIRPKVPFIDLNAEPGKDIREGQAVSDARDIYKNAKALGMQLGKLSDYVIIGESVPGGTTTAMGVMKALGYYGRVSSSFPDNPVGLKDRVIAAGMKAAGLTFGCLRDDPLKAVECMGDPMMPAAAGLVDGLNTKVVLAGGTQMVSVLGIIKHLGLIRDVSIATTSYVARDKTANFIEMTEKLGYQAFTADPGFAESRIKGLRMYENGEVKEGVGAGGAMLAAAMLGFSQKEFRKKVEEVYDSTFGNVINS